MDFSLNEQQEDIRKRFGRFCREVVVPKAAEIDLLGRPDPGVVRAAAPARLRAQRRWCSCRPTFTPGKWKARKRC